MITINIDELAPLGPTVATIAILIGTFVAYMSHSSNKSGKNHGIDDAQLPPRVRSWIPFIGSAIEMGKDVLQFQRKYFEQFQTQIFTATIGGKTCHFLSPSEHVSLLDRLPELDRESIQKQFATNALGCDLSVMDFTFSDKMVNKQFLKIYQFYLLDKKELNLTIQSAQSGLNKLIAEKILPFCSSSDNKMNGSSNGCDNTKIFNLYDIVSRCVYKASVQSLISTEMGEDKVYTHFQQFDEQVALLHSGVPNFVCSKAISAREEMLRLLKESTNVSPIIKARDEIYASYGRAAANEGKRSNVGIQWASVGNSIPAIFWFLYFIIQDKEAYESIQNEIDSLNKSREEGDKNKNYTIEELDKLPILNSAFKESLRMSLINFAVREVKTDFVLNLPQSDGNGKKKGSDKKYLMEKGSTIMCYLPVLHRDGEIFKDPDTFVYDRFLKNQDTGKEPEFFKNGKKVNTRFWGGGAHLCPGRKFIEYEIKAFVASLMTDLRMQFVEEPDTPPDFHKSYVGIGVGKPDRNVSVRFSMRHSSSSVEK